MFPLAFKHLLLYCANVTFFWNRVMYFSLWGQQALTCWLPPCSGPIKSPLFAPLTLEHGSSVSGGAGQKACSEAYNGPANRSCALTPSSSQNHSRALLCTATPGAARVGGKENPQNMFLQHSWKGTALPSEWREQFSRDDTQHTSQPAGVSQPHLHTSFRLGPLQTQTTAHSPWT